MPPWPKRVRNPRHADRRVWHRSIAALPPMRRSPPSSRRPPSARYAADTRRRRPHSSGPRGSAKPIRPRGAWCRGQDGPRGGTDRRARGLVDRSLPTADRPCRAGLLALRGSSRASLAPSRRPSPGCWTESRERGSVLSLEMLLGFGMTVYLADYEKMLDCACGLPSSRRSPTPIASSSCFSPGSRRAGWRLRRAKELLECDRDRDPSRRRPLPDLGVGRCRSSRQLGRRSALRQPSSSPRTRTRARVDTAVRPRGPSDTTARTRPIRPRACLGRGGPKPRARPRAAMDRDLEPG